MLEHLEDEASAVGARLKKVREILGLNKREFSERAGISEQAYGAFENGKRQLSLAAAKQLRRTYGLSLEFMFFGKTDDLPHRIAKSLQPYATSKCCNRDTPPDHL